MNSEFLGKISEHFRGQTQRIGRLFLYLGVVLLFISLIFLIVNVFYVAVIPFRISDNSSAIIFFSGILLAGLSQMFYNEPKRLILSLVLLTASLTVWVLYLAVFFYVHISVILYSNKAFYVPVQNEMTTPVVLDYLRYFIIASIVTYAATLLILLGIRRSFEKFPPVCLAVGLVLILVFTGDALGGMVNGELFQNLLLINGGNILESFISFSIIIISLGITVAFVSIFFPRIGFLKLFLTIFAITLLFQFALFYEASIEFSSITLYYILQGKAIFNSIIRGIIEICIYAGVSLLALDFSSSVRKKSSLMGLLSVVIPVFGTAFILLIILKLIGSSLFIGNISINVGAALILYFALIITATISIFFSRTKASDKGNFSPVLFPLLILAVPILGSYSFRTALNFQILLIYTIIIITSAIFIADTLSILLSKVQSPVMGRLSISYIVNEEDFSKPDQVEKPSEQIIIDDTVKKPVPAYWVGRKIWDHTITDTDNSFDPSFFHLFGISSSRSLRKLSIMVLKQYSSHGIKLAFDSNILDLMEKRFNGLKKLNEIQDAQQVLEIHFKSASSYMENAENYKNAPPVVIMEDIQKIDLTLLDFSMGTLKSKQVFFKVIMEILNVLEKAHSMGIIHGNICKSTVLIESSGRASEFSNVVGSDHILDNLLLSDYIRVKLGNFGGESFEPYPLFLLFVSFYFHLNWYHSYYYLLI